MRRMFLYLSLIIFVGVLGVSWVTQGTGIVKNDPTRNIYIPQQPMMSVQVKAAYNGRDMFFRYRWPTEQPSIYRHMLSCGMGRARMIIRRPVGISPRSDLQADSGRRKE